MPMLLNPDSFQKLPLADIQKLSKQAIKTATGKNLMKFVSAKDVDFGGKKVSLFILTDDPKNFEKVLKAKKAQPVLGECKILKGPKGSQIAIKSVESGKREQIEQLIAKAFPNDTTLETVSFAATIAQASHDKAGTKVVITPNHVQAMVKLSYDVQEFQKFASAFKKLADKYNMKDYDKLPVKIWADLISGLANSGYAKEVITMDASDPTGNAFMLRVQGPAGKPMREAALARAMTSLQKYTAHAEKYLDKVITEVRKAGGNPTWAFWSGTGAQAAAKAENSSGVVLEGSVGAWFNEVWQFEHLTGVQDLALWASMSEMYAKKAAEYYEVFKFRGYVGPTASREQSVFMQIEQPTFIEVLNQRVQVDVPKVDWFVVDCVKDATGRWNPTGKPSMPVAGRAEAVAKVKELYGG